MAYKSLFDMLVEEDPNLRLISDNFHFCDSLDRVIDELGESLNENNELALVKRALHAPRIIRAVIDYKISNRYDSEPRRLLNDAINLGLSVYRQDESSLEDLTSFRFRLVNSGNGELLDKQVHQPDDHMVFEDSHPKLNKTTANRLLEETEGKPVLFIAMAHSGIMPGMDTYLRYSDKIDNDESHFYTVRLSSTRWRDVIPKISLAERISLFEYSERLQTVIFDEHRASGYTLDKAKDYFTKNLSEDKNILVDCNVDRRPEYYKIRGITNKTL